MNESSSHALERLRRALEGKPDIGREPLPFGSLFDSFGDIFGGKEGAEKLKKAAEKKAKEMQGDA